MQKWLLRSSGYGGHILNELLVETMPHLKEEKLLRAAWALRDAGSAAASAQLIEESALPRVGTPSKCHLQEPAIQHLAL